MKRLITYVILFVFMPTLAQAQLINCPNGFNSNTSGNCSTKGTSARFQLLNQTALFGTSIELMNSSGHQAFNLWTTVPANIQAFSTTFTFHDDCSVDPGACGFGWGFMGLGDDNTNQACFIQPYCSHYSDGATTSLSWDQGCSDSDGLDQNGNCWGMNLFLVKFDTCQLSSTTCGQSLTNYYQASGTPVQVATVASDGGGAYLTLDSPVPLPANGTIVADVSTSSGGGANTTFILSGSTTSKLYVASTSGFSAADHITVYNTIGGTWPHSASDLNMASSGINLSGTHEFTVTIHYNDSTVGAGNMSESITDETTSANFTTTYSTDTKGNPINIPGVMAGADTAFIGFGGSGAGAVMTTYIDTWVYTVESPARPTPTPRATAKAAATATRTATGTARRYLPDRRDIVASEMMGF